MLNPCCCISPRIGAFIFAVIDLVVSISYTLTIANAIIDGSSHKEIWGELALCICLVLLAVLLFFGAIKNSQEKVKMWLILWVIFLIVAILFQVFNIWTSRLGPRTGSSLAGFLIFMYQMWVVYAYLLELRYGPAGLTYCPAQCVQV